jgi:hypothetical protein
MIATTLFPRSKLLSTRMGMDTKELENAACVWALMHRGSAPEPVQLLFTGKSSLYSDYVKNLATAFLLVYVEAADRLSGLKRDDVDATACWLVALQLIGGTV